MKSQMQDNTCCPAHRQRATQKKLRIVSESISLHLWVRFSPKMESLTRFAALLFPLSSKKRTESLNLK